MFGERLDPIEDMLAFTTPIFIGWHGTSTVRSKKMSPAQTRAGTLTTQGRTPARRRPPVNERALKVALLLGALGAVAALPSAAGRQAPDYAGFAQPDCAPWDGAAVWIVLTRGMAGARSDSLELWAYANVSDVVGRRILISPDPRSDGRSGAALYCAAARPCTPAAAGSFVLDRHQESGPLVGHFDLELAGAEFRRGRFTAAWRPARPLCG